MQGRDGLPLRMRANSPFPVVVVVCRAMGVRPLGVLQGWEGGGGKWPGWAEKLCGECGHRRGYMMFISGLSVPLPLGDVPICHACLPVQRSCSLAPAVLCHFFKGLLDPIRERVSHGVCVCVHRPPLMVWVWVWVYTGPPPVLLLLPPWPQVRRKASDELQQAKQQADRKLDDIAGNLRMQVRRGQDQGRHHMAAG